jgi:hypothetical protein
MFLGFNRILQNVVMFFSILENFVVLIRILFMGSSYMCQMNLWALSMSMLFVHTSECCWTMPFQIFHGMHARERKVDMHLHAHDSGGFLWSMYYTKSHTCPILIE